MKWLSPSNTLIFLFQSRVMINIKNLVLSTAQETDILGSYLGETVHRISQ